MNNKLLLVNDITGYGRVSCFAMTPILATLGIHPYILPTALVSNTLDYGKSTILDTTEFMKDSISKWDELGFSFNTIATGFISSDEQVDIICSLIDKQDSPFVLVDPIMADSGELYDNMYECAVACNRKLISRADVITPNYTEATLLADMFQDRSSLSRDEYKLLAYKLIELGASTVVITSCKLDNGLSFNLILDPESASEPEFLFYDEIPCQLIGTGDAFSAVLIAHLMNKATLKDSVSRAADFVSKIIRANQDAPDRFDIYIEGLLSELL